MYIQVIYKLPNLKIDYKLHFPLFEFAFENFIPSYTGLKIVTHWSPMDQKLSAGD